MTDADTRLGVLLGRYEELRETDPDASISALKDEAGALYSELVELAGCVDELMAHVPPTTPPAQALVAGQSRWWLGGLVAAGLVIGAGVFHQRSNGDPISNAERVAVVVPPEDPFDPKGTTAFARAYGIPFEAPVALLPAPIDALPAVDGAAKLAELAVDARCVALEQSRLPADARDHATARYIVAERLYRAGHFREAYDMAYRLSEDHPRRREPLDLVLRTLWGLDLVQSKLYAGLYERYLSLD